MAWPAVSLLEALDDVSGGNVKTPQSEYLADGAVPIIDQGQALIGGYSADTTAAFRGELPVIVFGDHTRAVKYVDFPFGMGADGVKVLQPKPGLDARFAYHCLRTVRLPDVGYSRHFKFLKEARVPLPPIVEQRRVADILDRADTLRAKRREALALLDGLTQSIFIDMFGDPVMNSLGWDDSARLEDVADLSSGITKGRKLNGHATREVPYMAVANVQDRRLDLTSVKTIAATEQEIDRYRLQEGDLLLTEGGDPDKLGRGSLWTGEIEECIHQNHIFRVRVTDSGRIRPLFLSWLVASDRGKRYFLRSAKQTTGIASINLSQLRLFPLLLPPLPIQIEFEAKIRSLRAVQSSASIQAGELDAILASLQQWAFGGEL